MRSKFRYWKAFQFSQRTAHTSQRSSKLRRGNDTLGMYLAEEFVLVCVDHVELTRPAHRLADAVRHQGVILAQIGAYYQHALETRHVGHRHAEPEAAMDLVIERKIRLPQTVIDVAATEAAHQLLQQK